MISKIITQKSLEFISNNLALFIAVPTVIGGIKQLNSLFTLSPILYKFFSFGQLIIDGFIILIELLIIYTVFAIYESIVKIITNPSASQTKKKFQIFFYINFSIFCLILILYTIFRNLYNADVSNYYLKSLGYLGIIFFVLNLINLNAAVNKGNVIFFLAVFFGLVFFPEPKGTIENFVTLTKEVQKIYPNAKLSYFNDQYIFYETSNGKYLVKKIDNLFDSSISK